MNIKSNLSLALLILSFTSIPTASVFAQTRVALHATQEEINIWQQRRINGPYLDDWNRIIARANSFKGSPTQGTWPGNQLNTPWEGNKVRDGLQLPNYYPCGSTSNPDAGGRGCADYVRDSAFVFMVTGDVSYRTPVRTFLLNHATNPNLNFANTTKWRSNYRDQDKDFQITIWIRKVTYAYSYIRGSLSEADKATIDGWMLSMGQFWDKVCDNEIKAVYPGRDDDVYASGLGSDGAMTHYNGWMVTTRSDAWESKQSFHQAAAAAIAVVVNNAVLKASSKKYVKEWLRFRVFSDGTVGDQARWIRHGTAAGPGNGYHYIGSAIGHITSIVDHLARDGDTELYTYTTSLGNGGTGIRDTSGGPKSYRQVIRRMSDMNLHKVNVYGSTDSNLTECKRIDSDVQNCGYSQNFRIIHDVGVAQGNLFSPDSVVSMNVTRTPPSSPTNGGYDPFGGSYGHLPGARFMFAQMQGKVYPYSSETASSPASSPPPFAPSQLTVINPIE